MRGVFRYWRWICDLWTLLRPSRFSLLAVLLYAVFVMFVGQGRELFLLMPEYPIRYYLAILILAVTVWYWGRLMVSYRYLIPERRHIDHDALRADVDKFKADHQQRKLAKDAAGKPVYAAAEIDAEQQRIAAYEAKANEVTGTTDTPAIGSKDFETWMLRLPRLYGALVFFVSGGVACYVWWRFLPAYNSRSPGELWSHFALLFYGLSLLFSGGLFWWLAHKRRDICWCIRARLRRGLVTDENIACGRLLFAGTAERSQIKSDQSANFSAPLSGWRNRVDQLFTAKSEGDLRDDWRWYAWEVIPGAAKFWMGLVTAVLGLFFVFALWNPIAFAIMVTPLGSVLLPVSFLAMAGTWIVFWLDDRRFPVFITLVLVLSLVSLVTDTHQVRVMDPDAAFKPSQRAPATALVDKATRTPIIVATAGGGIRAAYWTAAVLAELDRQPAFHDNLLAISTVSGGGLGAAVYLAARQCVAEAQVKGTTPAPTVEQLVTEFLSKDYFLSAALAAYLSRDLFVGLFPGRGQALERSWERGWREVCPGAEENPFATATLRLWSSPENVRPALLINATLVQTGKRIVTAPIRIEPEVFREALDLYDFVGSSELSLSTAVHNGARFTYVSPAGTLKAKLQDDTVTTGQVIDGGYFENYGAETAADLLSRLCLQAGATRCPTVVQPVIIQISSDPGLADTAEVTTGITGPTETTRATQLGAPLKGIKETRPARGVSAMKRLNHLSGWFGATFAHFRLCELKNREAPPLGWLLTDSARTTIRDHLSTACHKDHTTEQDPHDNRTELERIQTVLGGQ